MVHEMKLRNDPFERISKGLKTIEIRLYDEKRKKIKENDFIEFTSIDNGNKIKVKVLKIHKFKTFKELFDYFDNSYLGHKEDEKISYNRMYEYYSKEEEKKYGVVGIEIKLIKGDEK